jgi:hypothetical protein
MKPGPTPAQRRQLWWTVSAIAAVLAFVTTCWGAPQLWEWFGVGLLPFHFADLHALLAASDAHALGLDPYATPSVFDPLGRPHVYGPWWLWMHALGLTRADVFWLGALLCVATVVTLGVLLRPACLREAVATFLLLASPPLLLSYERGNNDLVVVLLLAAAGAAGAGRFGVVVQSLTLWTGAVLKFYPIAALPLLGVGRNWRRAAAGVGLTLLLTAVTVWIWRTDFQTVLGLVPRPNTYYGFGLKVVQSIWLSLEPGSQGVFAAGIAFGLAAVFWSGGWKRAAREEMTRAGTAGWFIAGGATWVFCFVSNANFPYRVALLGLVAVAWFRMWRGMGTEEKAGGRLVMLLLATAWMRIARILLLFVFGAHERSGGVFSYGLEHGLAIGLSAVILTALVAWALGCLARWRDEWRGVSA